MTRRELQRLAERYLPGPLLRALRTTSRCVARHRLSRRIHALRREHEARNAGLPPNRLRLRDGREVTVTRFAREYYEFFCYKEPDIVAEYDAFALMTRDRRRLLDVGAEHGFYSVAFTALGPDRAAVAVEPSPVAYPALTDQLRANPAAAITPLAIALGAAPGEIEMAVRGNHAVTAFGFYPELTADRLVIPVRTADAVCQELGFEPDTIKVDVEGYELFVLQGAGGVLARCRPLLLLELHPEMTNALGYTIADLLTFLTDRGYAQIDPRTGRPCSMAQPVGGVMRVVFRHLGSTRGT